MTGSHMGTRSRYRRGCRCADCRRANTAYVTFRNRVRAARGRATPFPPRRSVTLDLPGLRVAVSASPDDFDTPPVRALVGLILDHAAAYREGQWA